MALPLIGRTGCRAAEDQLVLIALGTLADAERIGVERHISGCARCARTRRDLELAGSAYDQAFVRLRSRRAHIAAGRARLAAATEHRVGFALALPGRLLRLRLAEAALGFGVMTLAVASSVGVEPSRAVAPLPSKTAVVAPAAAAPQPEDAPRIRAARLRYSEVGDMVFKVTAGSPY